MKMDKIEWPGVKKILQVSAFKLIQNNFWVTDESFHIL